MRIFTHTIIMRIFNHSSRRFHGRLWIARLGYVKIKTFKNLQLPLTVRRPFYRLLVEFHCTFSFLVKYYHIMFINIVIQGQGVVDFIVVDWLGNSATASRRSSPVGR